MNNFSNESSPVACIDLSEFDDYDIISDDFSRNQGKDSETVVIQQDEVCQPTNLEVYIKEWNELYSSNVDIPKLKKKALCGELRSSLFRSICWRCLLGILHGEPKQWLMELKTHRSHYSDLWVELHKNPWNVERSPSDNPLSQEAESIWQKYFSNEELKSVIHQDVVRTFPGINFFRDDKIQSLMVRILFCYARQNSLLCYRQGMHEILAPLIFILHCDYQALLHYKSKGLTNSELTDILDPKFIEEDAYSIFKHIMNHTEYSYRIKNMVPTSTDYFTSLVESEKSCENEVVIRLQYIKDNILQTSDPDLNKHLNELDIPLHLFGIRWLRLLFGREFPFQELLVLWDAIFAVDNFELVNYVVVAMLTAIRSILLAGDYTICLTNLMRYPPGVDVMFVIEYSLHLMNPSLYPAPPVASFVNKPVTLITKYKNKITEVSENISNDRLKFVPTRPTKWLQGKLQPTCIAGYGDGDGNIADGVTLEDPKLMKANAENLKSILMHVHQKLSQYCNILNCHLTEPLNAEVKQALDGINELCNYIKSQQVHYSVVEIEPAVEAGEVGQPPVLVKKRNMVRKPSKHQVSDTKASTMPEVAKKLPSGELQVFKHTEGGVIVGAPMTDPLRLMKKSFSNSVNKNEEKK